MVNTKIPEATNAKSNVKIIVNSIDNIFDTDRDNYTNRVLVLLTDSVAYMLEAWRIFKKKYPNMLRALHMAFIGFLNLLETNFRTLIN